MKKFIFISGLLIVIVAGTFFSFREKAISPEKLIEQKLLVQVDSFVIAVKSLQAAAENRSANNNELQKLFLQTRLAYKNFEWAAEYFVPAASKFVNGAPVQEVEVSGQVFEPAGLQVIEPSLFPKYDTSRKKELIQQLELLQSRCNKYKSYFGNIDIFDWQVFDAAKLEIFRILTLGITGFDNPLSQNSMVESATALESVKRIFISYIDKKCTEDLVKKIDEAGKYLANNNDFNSFNRAEFIVNYGNFISKEISDLEKKLDIHVIRYNRLLNQDAKTLFDTNAFNVNAFVPDQSFFTNDKKILLGKLLFSDPILSGTGKRSCQSCHQPEKAFTDGIAKNTLINGSGLLERNTPTLLNAALQPSQFYDLRVKTLEDQSLSVVQNIGEMHGSMKLSVDKLWRDKTYSQMFTDAFPKKDRQEIDTLEVMNAIGSYVRSLTFLNSRFDEYMRGNKAAMNAKEINGFNLFMGKAKCATCHYMPLFNGTFPPRYMKIETEVIGVPQSAANNKIDSDMGRYNIIKIESLRHAFKTPSIRNVSRTAPYMHNGVFATLEQVVDFYDKGGGAGLGLKIDNQTLPFDKLNLTEKERDDIIAFMKTLDSR